MIFTLNFYTFVHAMYKYVLNSVVKMSPKFTQYFDYYAIVYLGGVFRGHGIVYLL